MILLRQKGVDEEFGVEYGNCVERKRFSTVGVHQAEKVAIFHNPDVGYAAWNAHIYCANVVRIFERQSVGGLGSRVIKII